MNKNEKLAQQLCDNLNYFIKKLESLYSSLPLTQELVKETNKKAILDYERFLNEQTREKYVDEAGIKKERLLVTDITRFELLRNRKIVSFLSASIIPNSLFIYLVCVYDAFLGKLLKLLFQINPETLNSSEKKFSFTELLQFENLDNAKDYLISKEVESILRESHFEQISKIEKRFNVAIKDKFKLFPQFIEITERRNLLVHADGEVSKQYIDVCNANKYEFIKHPKIGEKLVVDYGYFNKAFQVMFELGVSFTHFMLIKHFKDELQIAVDNLSDITYELIVKEHYLLAINILEFGLKFSKHYTDNDKKRFLINLAQAYKWQGEEEKCQNIIKNEDWSACEYKFKLSVEVLQSNFAEAAKTMKKIGADDNFQTDYQTWPLFKKFRNSTDFQQMFKELYKMEFVYKEYQEDEIEGVKLLSAKKR